MYENILKAIGLIELLLIIIGLFGNIFIFRVSLNLLKTNTTFLFLAFLSVCDMISPLWWNLSHFIDPIFEVDSQDSNFYYCKIFNFFQFSSLQLSAWFLVLMSIDRYLSVVIVSWKNVYFKYNRALKVCMLNVLIFGALNFHMFFTFGQMHVVNGTTFVLCYATPDNPESEIMNVWSLVHTFLYSYIPFTLLFISNVLLIIHLKRKRVVKTPGSANRQSSMNITVITITLMFIFMTLPSTIVTIYSPLLLASDIGLVAIAASDTLDNIYHTFNFALLLITNKRFLAESKILLCNSIKRETARDSIKSSSLQKVNSNLPNTHIYL